MAQPPTYTRQTSFVGALVANPTAPFPVQSLDTEFNTIKTTLDATLTNLALIQRDDGELRASVVSGSLASAVADAASSAAAAATSALDADAARDEAVALMGTAGLITETHITNVTANQQAITNKLQFLQAGTGAVTRSVQDELRDQISVEQFGALGGLVTNYSTEIQAALDAAEAIGAKEVYFPEQYYICTATLQVPDGVTLVGRGVGLWDVVFHDRDKTWTGTNLLFKGTGTKNHSFYGITSGVDNGGTVTVGADTAKLTSFMNTDSTNATRATAKSFSVGIKPKTTNGSSHWGLRNMRIVPYDTTNGLAEYSDETSTSLGDDWDVGVLLQDSEYVSLDNVQVVGYWRMAGLAVVTPGLVDYAKGERNNFTDCKFQGHAGVIIRATDLWKVTGTTANSLTIRHNSEHYWPTSGTFESTDGSTDFAYTGLSYSAPGLTFTGVTPDPSGKTQIRALRRGSGMAGTQFHNCMVHGLDHVSGVAAAGMGFAAPSKALEMSGFPIRGVEFWNTKFQTDEVVCAHFHEADDTLMFGCQFESGGTGLMLASPLESASAATAPSGATYNLRWYATVMSGVTTTAFTPRTMYDDWRQVGPGDDLTGNFIINALTGQDMILKQAASKSIYTQTSAGTNVTRVTSGGNFQLENGANLIFNTGTGIINNNDATSGYQIKLAGVTKLTMFSSGNSEHVGNWSPGTDITPSLGSSSKRWLTLWAQDICNTTTRLRKLWTTDIDSTNAVNVSSDARNKTNIVDEPLGLDFINALRPVQYTLVDSGDRDAEGNILPGIRPHHGLLAQELKATIEKLGIDHAAFTETPILDDDGNDTGETKMAVRYGELTSSLIKAVQELSARIEALEAAQVV